MLGGEVIAGVRAYIFGNCLSLVEDSLAAGPAAAGGVRRLRPTNAGASGACRFCGNELGGVSAAVPGDGAICQACVALARDALDTPWTPHSAGGFLK